MWLAVLTLIFSDWIEVLGKISGLVFGAFGAFAGFVLDTGHGQHDYHSREPNWRTLAERSRPRSREGTHRAALPDQHQEPGS